MTKSGVQELQEFRSAEGWAGVALTGKANRMSRNLAQSMSASAVVSCQLAPVTPELLN